MSKIQANPPGDYLRILEFMDKDISIESYTMTGTFQGDVYISPELLPLLIKALQKIQDKRQAKNE